MIFGGADDLGPGLNALIWTLAALSLCTVAMRLVSRTALAEGSQAGLDDALTVFSVVVILIGTIIISVAVAAGFGKHITAIDPANAERVAKLIVIMNSITIWGFSLPKFAIIALLKRILNFGRPLEATLWILAIVGQIFILATSVIWFEQCKPVQFQWDKSIPGGYCWPLSVITNLGYFTSAYSAALDLLFALLPIPFIAKLNMSTQRKVAVSAAFAFSGIAFVVSIYKITTFSGVIAALPLDPTYAAVPLTVWTMVEANVLVITASLPTIGPLVRLATRRVRTLAPGASAYLRTPSSTGAGAPITLESTSDASKAFYAQGSPPVGIEDVPLVERGQAGIMRKTTVEVSHDAIASEERRLYVNGSGGRDVKEWL